MTVGRSSCDGGAEAQPTFIGGRKPWALPGAIQADIGITQLLL
jgi:hypothetical protein